MWTAPAARRTLLSQARRFEVSTTADRHARLTSLTPDCFQYASKFRGLNRAHALARYAAGSREAGAHRRHPSDLSLDGTGPTFRKVGRPVVNAAEALDRWKAAYAANENESLAA